MRSQVCLLRRGFTTLTAATALVAAGFAAWGGGVANAASASGSPIVVGGVCDMVGPFSNPGSCRAAKAYFDGVNASGGVNGHPIKYTIGDGASSPASATQAATRLIEVTKIQALVGSVSIGGCQSYISQLTSAKLYGIDAVGGLGCWETPNITPTSAGLGGTIAANTYFM